MMTPAVIAIVCLGMHMLCSSILAYRRAKNNNDLLLATSCFFATCGFATSMLAQLLPLVMR